MDLAAIPLQRVQETRVGNLEEHKVFVEETARVITPVSSRRRVVSEDQHRCASTGLAAKPADAR